MGNQEAKHKKAAAAAAAAAAASGNGSYPSLDEGWREAGGDAAKKGGKKQGKHGGKGAASSGGGGGSGGAGGGGGTHGSGPARKKNKSEAKSSVFSIRKRKGNLKGRGDACSSETGSKEDILASQHDELDGTKTPELSADELGQSDVETALPGSKRGAEQDQGGADGREMQRKTLRAAASPTEDGGQKGGSSGSDTDIYSFHSAADHEDLLADIQLAIRLQHQQQHEGPRGTDSSWVGEGRKQSNGTVKLTPPELLDLTPELELGSDALSFLETAPLSECVKHAEKLAAAAVAAPVAAATTHIPSPTEQLGTREGQRESEGAEPPQLREAPLCAAVGTKDQHAWLQQWPSDTAVAMVTAGGTGVVAVGPVATTTGGNSLPEAPGEEVEESEGKSQQEDEDMDLSDHVCLDPAEELPSGTGSQEADTQLDPCTSVESLQDSPSTDTEPSFSAAVSGVSVLASSPVERRRKSSVSPSLPPQESPTLAKRLLRSNYSPSGPVVKPYPPIFPSYIKTTTRQLSSPGQSPALSPSHSPLSPRKAHHHLHRYLLHKITHHGG